MCLQNQFISKGEDIPKQYTVFRETWRSNSLPTYTKSGHSEIDDLLEERRPPLQLADSDRPQMTVKYIDGSGKARCKGGSDLRMSQAYPRQWLELSVASCSINSFPKIKSTPQTPSLHDHWLQHHPPCVSVPRFGKAVAKVRTRNQKRIRNAACRFLRASFKTEHVLDRSKATHAHWMKHANLASVLHFLASKQLGAD